MPWIDRALGVSEKRSGARRALSQDPLGDFNLAMSTRLIRP
jgi:hypothetical protein